MLSSKIAALAVPANRLAALVFTDIVGSTQMKSSLGMPVYVKLLARHNELFDTGITEISGGEVIKHTGDGYFAAFPTASDAVRFALRFQARMKLEPWGQHKIGTRLGIHIGEVTMMDMAGKNDVVGLSADVAARLMSLGSGGQILLTATAFNDARQFVDNSPDFLKGAPPLRWMAHGRYLFKGSDDPMEVYEVGIENVSPLNCPADSEKAHRVVPHDQEQTLGWRPAVGLDIPDRPKWKFVQKLGEGGFGEVWLGEHGLVKERRVFKFCFDVDRVRGLKREYTLFRLLREALGNRDDIATLRDVKLENPPFFLESDYTEGGNLLEWAEQKGGITVLSMAQRLAFLARVSDAVAAAHSVGVLHKDIKPANILVHPAPNGELLPRLADFGIGEISDKSRLQANNVIATGFTDVTVEKSTSSGTRMYAPPESMLNKPFTTHGDIYALGVMLYQCAVGDLLKPLGSGWEDDIGDELLRKDIAAMVAGDPARRIDSAAEVARRIRSLEQRKADLAKARREEEEKQAAEARRAHKRKMRQRMLAAAVAGCVVLGLIAIVACFYIRQLSIERRNTEMAVNYLLGTIRDADPLNAPDEKLMARDVILGAAEALDERFPQQTTQKASLEVALGDALVHFGRSDDADKLYSDATAIVLRQPHADRNLLFSATYGHGMALLKKQDYAAAKPVLHDLLEQETQKLGPTDRVTLQTSLSYAAAVNNVDGAKAAEPLYRTALRQRREKFKDDDKDTIQSMSAFANLERDLGQLDRAAKLAREALDWRAQPQHFGEKNHYTLASKLNYGLILIDLGKAKDALPLIKAVVDARAEARGAGDQDTLRARSAYAEALFATGQVAEAERQFREALDGFSHSSSGMQDAYAMPAQVGYANLLTSSGRAAEAEPMIRLAYETLLKTKGPEYRETIRAAWVMARTLGVLKNPEAAKYAAAARDNAMSAFGGESRLTAMYSSAADKASVAATQASGGNAAAQ